MSDHSNAQGSAGSRPTAGEPLGVPPQVGGTPGSPTAPPPPVPYDDRTGATASRPRPSLNISFDKPLELALGILAVGGVVLGLLLSADAPNDVGGGDASTQLWDAMGWTWALLAIAAAATALLPVISRTLGLADRLVWSIVATGAGVLALWWVLFILPRIESNRAFLVTVGVLAAVLVAVRTRQAAGAPALR